MIMKNSSIKLPVLITFFIVISLSACLGDLRSDFAKLVISFGNEGRAVYDPNDLETHQKLEHRITLIGAAKTLNFTFNGGGTFEVNVEPGNWNISVVSFLEDDVYAAGSKDVILQSGINNETINMYQAHLVRFIANSDNIVPDQIIFHGMKAEKPQNPSYLENGSSFDDWYNSSDERFDFNKNQIFESITLHAKWGEFPVTGNSLAEKLDWIYYNSVDGGNYVIEVTTDESLAPRTLSYPGKLISITLKSNDATQKKIELEKYQKGSMFTVGSGVTLTLDSYIVLVGSKNDYSLVSVNGNGKLIMNPLSKIIENKDDEEDNYILGGGVYIGGTFIMNGGEISGNTAGQGGGVWVTTGGTFTMNGGKISNNQAVIEYGGGGVKVSNGTFIMNGGEISNNNSLKKDRHGGGVSVGSNESDDRSTFIMNDGKIFGNTAEQGGGVFMWIGTFTMNGGEIFNNEASTWGGGVFASGKTFTMNGGKIYDNIAKECGGGVNAIGNTFTMKGGEISGNSAEKGGGVSVNNWGEGGTFTMNGGKISGNNKVAPSDYYEGGGVYVFENATFTMTGGKISNNNASLGGGVYVESGGYFSLKEKGEISDNTAQGGGSNVYRE